MFSSNTSAANDNATYIEDVFSTYLYTGNGSTQAINNGLDLSGKGGMVWVKNRGRASTGSALISSASAATNWLGSNITNGYQTFPRFSSLNSNGFTADSGSNSYTATNYLNDTYVSWSFRKQPKFFDVVTWTGNGVDGRAIPHSLASAPGCVIIKRTDSADDWQVWHRSLPSNPGAGLYLNTTSAELATYRIYPNPDSTNIYVSSGASVNASGGTYVAYVFAHNAGGFGLTGTDNVISCGSFTSDALGQASVTLNYEPQWVMIKRTDGTSDWTILDNMRGWAVTSSGDAALSANTSNAETSATEWGYPTATGFSVNEPFGSTNWIYIAIRKGPMKVPTSGTSVFAQNNTSSVTTNFPVDLYFNPFPAGNTYNVVTGDRLRGGVNFLSTSQSAVENQLGTPTNFASNTAIQATFGGGIIHALRRAPNFFDQVCYSGAGIGTTQNVSHNLKVAPELMIVKLRNQGASSWWVYHSALGPTKGLILNDTGTPITNSSTWNDTAPTSSVFTVGSLAAVNFQNTWNYVAYLFATCIGVSKVGSYTGNGSSQTINCGFTGGARFVLIKRTDSTGDWYVWDTARGIVAGNDPHLSLNTTAAEVTTDDTIDPDSTGFIVNQVTATNVNVSSATYIYLAIA